MVAMRIPRWVLPAAVGGVLAMTVTDTVMMRRHRVTVRPQGSTTVQELRPSPFHRAAPEIVVIETLKAPVIRVATPAAAEPVAEAADPPRESRWDQFVSKIPLLRHWRKHPPADGTQPR
jgi:hypothetical protein